MLPVLRFPSAFRAVCALFSNSLVHFERFAPFSQILCSLSSGLLPVLEFPSPFRALCSLFSNSLVHFERFAPCSQILYSLSSGLLPVLEFPIATFEHLAPCSQIADEPTLFPHVLTDPEARPKTDPGVHKRLPQNVVPLVPPFQKPGRARPCAGTTHPKKKSHRSKKNPKEILHPITTDPLVGLHSTSVYHH